MSTLGFYHFLELPAEIQGKIFHIASYAATPSERIGLLGVSKAIRPWVEDILYGHVYLYGSRRLAPLALFIQSRPGLLAQKTKSLYLTASSPPEENIKIALDTLLELKSLRAAQVYISKREKEVLHHLGHMAQLNTLMLDSIFNKISQEYTRNMSSYPFTGTLTHLSMASWNDGPHAHFLACFPRLTHFSVTCYEPPTSAWRTLWSMNLPPSLRVFAILDQWSRITTGRGRMPETCSQTRTTVVVRIPQGWGVPEIFAHLTEMWISAENLLAAQAEVAWEGEILIELDNWYVVNSSMSMSAGLNM
ncbi:hypothetical protein DL96DRAFT_1609710, partial [Flagelloscypha sp. PMI_526]